MDDMKTYNTSALLRTKLLSGEPRMNSFDLLLWITRCGPDKFQRQPEINNMLHRNSLVVAQSNKHTVIHKR